MTFYKDLVLAISVLCISQTTPTLAAQPAPAAVSTAQLEFMQKRIGELEDRIKALEESPSHKPKEYPELSLMEILMMDTIRARCRRDTIGGKRVPMPQRVTS